MVTRKVFQKSENNDYVTHSVRVPESSDGEMVDGHVPQLLWADTRAETLPEEDIDCKLLTSNWCPNHGDEFSAAILAGKTNREDVVGAAAA